MGVNVNVTVCEPQPDAVVTVIHDSDVVAVHMQLVVVVTDVDPEPPAGLTLTVAGFNEYWQPVLAAWVTVKVRPAIDKVPLRCDELVDGATVNATLPFPLPLDPDVIVIHAALLCAVQLQPAALVTADDPVPPAATTDWVVGVIEYEQVAAA